MFEEAPSAHSPLPVFAIHGRSRIQIDSSRPETASLPLSSPSVSSFCETVHFTLFKYVINLPFVQLSMKSV